MKVRLATKLRRLALSCLIASAAALATSPLSNIATAEEFDCADYIQTSDDVRSSCEFELREVAAMERRRFEECNQEELCGWVSEESMVEPAEPIIATRRVATRTSSSFDQSIAAVAATACASAGIHVEQIVEPFAMVGPKVIDSLEKVMELERWWQAAMENGVASDVMDSPADVAPEEEMQAELDALALEEPVDTESLGPSVLIVEEEAVVESPMVAEHKTALAEIVDAAESQVGASAIVATIEDSYLPYDLSASDLKLWSVIPVVREPFCIRSRSVSDDGLLWDNFDEVVAAEQTNELSSEPIAITEPANEPLVSSEPLEFDISADCLLDEWVWNVERAFDEDAPLQQWLRPSTYGQRLARLILGSTRMAETAAERLASVWPQSLDAPEIFDEDTAGNQLLARAGAVEASEPLIEPLPAAAEQIAEVPSESSIR